MVLHADQSPNRRCCDAAAAAAAAAASAALRAILGIASCWGQAEQGDSQRGHNKGRRRKRRR